MSNEEKTDWTQLIEALRREKVELQGQLEEKALRAEKAEALASLLDEKMGREALDKAEVRHKLEELSVRLSSERAKRLERMFFHLLRGWEPEGCSVDRYYVEAQRAVSLLEAALPAGDVQATWLIRQERDALLSSVEAWRREAESMKEASMKWAKDAGEARLVLNRVTRELGQMREERDRYRNALQELNRKASKAYSGPGESAVERSLQEELVSKSADVISLKAQLEEARAEAENNKEPGWLRGERERLLIVEKAFLEIKAWVDEKDGTGGGVQPGGLLKRVQRIVERLSLAYKEESKRLTSSRERERVGRGLVEELQFIAQETCPKCGGSEPWENEDGESGGGHEPGCKIGSFMRGELL